MKKMFMIAATGVLATSVAFIINKKRKSSISEDLVDDLTDTDEILPEEILVDECDEVSDETCETE